MTRNPITDGETVLSPLFGSLMNAHGAEAVLNGISPSVGTGDWDVDTTAGNVFINNTTASVSSATTTLTSPASDTDLDSGEFRVDLLTADDTGTINVAEGVAATQPITENTPSNEVVICGVIISGDASSLQSPNIRDYRTLLESDKDRYTEGGPHEITVDEFDGNTQENANNTVATAAGDIGIYDQDENWDSGETKTLQISPTELTAFEQTISSSSATVSEDAGSAVTVDSVTITYSDGSTDSASVNNNATSTADISYATGVVTQWEVVITRNEGGTIGVTDVRIQDMTVNDRDPHIHGV